MLLVQQPSITIPIASLQRDISTFAIGAITVAIASLSLGAFALRGRHKDRIALWFGVFAGLYGIRLLFQSGIFCAAIGITGDTGSSVGAWITFVIQLPATVYALSVIDALHTRVARGLLATAGVLAIVGSTSLLLGRGVAGVFTFNNILVLFVFIPVYVWMYWRSGRAERFFGVKIGFLIFLLSVIADNAAGVLLGRGFGLEPYGFLILLIALANMTARLNIESEEKLRDVERELAIARTIQRSILPDKVPQVRGLEVAVRYEPMTAVAGDFYDFIEFEDGRLGILVADVSGHGVPAALIASMLKMAFVSHAPNASDPAQLLTRLNEALCGRFQSHFVTAVYAVVDLAAGTLTYSGAAHPAAFLRRADGSYLALEENGLLLGAFDFAAYTSKTMPFSAGDGLLLYTDGLVEGTNVQGAEFGEERLKASIVSSAAHATIEKLFGHFAEWTHGTPQADDLTAVVIKRLAN